MDSSASAISYREARLADVPNMIRCRDGDPTSGPADPRMARYLEGKHHPRHALESRVLFVGLEDDSVIGYIGGHLTQRYHCDGELQYLYVVPQHRRNGIASELLALLAGWFAEQEASRICVDVVPENATARAFYARHGAVDLSECWMVWINVAAVLGK